MSEDTLPERFAARMGALLGPEFPPNIALAVSGGGDSMAMLALCHDWARHMGVGLWVVTVDHGLRPESAAEAAMVATECAALGHPHATLRWHWDGQGNLQDAARRARLDLIDRWRRGIEHVLMAHTQDDVAETFLMRLARGSGVDGLAAMSARRHIYRHPGGRKALPDTDVAQTGAPPPQPLENAASVQDTGSGFHVIRPLLEERRSTLRHYVTTLKVPFVDDPSNEDPAFDRVRARAALAEIGIDASVLATTAHRMARARDALTARASSVADSVVTQDVFGVLRLSRDAFAVVERDTQLRLMATALQWIGGHDYRPRAAPLAALLDRALAGGGATLHGAQVDVTPDEIVIYREFAAVSDHSVVAGPTSLWDRRWRLYSAAIEDMSVRALGDSGWRQIPRPHKADQQTESGVMQLAPPYAIARTLPAVFDDERLVAFQPWAFGPDYVAELCPPHGHFLALLNPH